MNTGALLLALEAIASAYSFSRADMLAMPIREIRWWSRAAEIRRAEQIVLLKMLRR